MIEATAEKLIRERRISETDRQALFDKLYSEVVMTVAADDLYQAARALVNGGIIDNIQRIDYYQTTKGKETDCFSCVSGLHSI